MSTESLSAITAAVPCTPSANPETAASVPDASPSATVAAVDLTLNVASASAVMVVDEGDDVQDVIAESCVLNIYKGVYFNIPASSEATPPLYYITRGRKIGIFSEWYTSYCLFW